MKAVRESMAFVVCVYVTIYVMNSTPESEFDDWYSDTHGGTKATWEMDDEIPDSDDFDDKYEE